MSKFRNLLTVATLATTAAMANPALAGKLGLGRPATAEEIAAWDVNVMPDGRGLPPGSGSVEHGEEIFSEYCAICHGDFAEGVDNWPKLAGGEGTLADKDPLKTVGSYWPYLTTTWDYVHRSMPFGNAQTLTPDQVYAIVAYILYSNDIVDEDFVLSRENFLEVEMPNKDGFIVDDRSQTEYTIFTEDNACYSDCKDKVEITMRAAVLDVTPEETRAKKVQELIRRTKPTQNATVEPAVATEDAAPAVPEAAPQAKVLDPELVAAGEKVFKKCKSCHQVGEGAKNRVGPVLNGVVGRDVAGVEGFKYSKALTGMGGKWTEENLAGFLANPKKFAKGTRMSFAGLKKPADIDAVIAYLKSVSQ